MPVSVVANTEGMSDEEFKKELDYWGPQADKRLNESKKKKRLFLKSLRNRLLILLTQVLAISTLLLNGFQGEGPDKERELVMFVIV